MSLPHHSSHRTAGPSSHTAGHSLQGTNMQHLRCWHRLSDPLLRKSSKRTRIQIIPSRNTSVHIGSFVSQVDFEVAFVPVVGKQMRTANSSTRPCSGGAVANILLHFPARTRTQHVRSVELCACQPLFVCGPCFVPISVAIWQRPYYCAMWIGSLAACVESTRVVSIVNGL